MSVPLARAEAARAQPAAAGSDALAGRVILVVDASSTAGWARLRALRESGLPWLRKPLHPAKLRAVLQELLR